MSEDTPHESRSNLRVLFAGRVPLTAISISPERRSLIKSFSGFDDLINETDKVEGIGILLAM